MTTTMRTRTPEEMAMREELDTLAAAERAALQAWNEARKSTPRGQAMDPKYSQNHDAAVYANQAAKHKYYPEIYSAPDPLTGTRD